MKLLFENWRKYLNEVIVTAGPWETKIFATDHTLTIMLNTVKKYHEQGDSIGEIMSRIGTHINRGELNIDIGAQSKGVQFNPDDLDKLIVAYANNYDKISVEEIIKLFKSEQLDTLDSGSTDEPKEEENEEFFRSRKVSSGDLKGFTFLQSVEDNIKLFSATSFSPEMEEQLGKLGFEILGRGAYRNVFSFKGSDKYVLKVANIETADALGSQTVMNLRDIRIGKNPKYKEFAPQVYAHDPDGRWFIVERTLPFKRPYTTLKTTFPELYNLVKGIENKKVKKDFRSLPVFAFKALVFAGLKSVPPGNNYVERHWDTFRNLHESAYKNAPTYKNFFDMVKAYSVDIEDLLDQYGWKNIGIGSEDGKLKITDPSTQADEGL